MYELTIDEIELLWGAITVLEAQDALLALRIADFPHMTKSARAKLHRTIYSSAYPASVGKCYVTERELERIVNE